MKLSTSTISQGWDLGLSELIEESPFISASHPTQFRQDANIEESNVYMIRRKPSWQVALRATKN